MLLLTLSFFPLPKAIAGIPKDDIAQWQLIKDNFYIDTTDFKVSKNHVSFWIREKNYNKRRLVIDCKNLTERELFGSKVSEAYPISPKTIKYEIATQLCFLTEVEGFSSERRKPSWAKRIIIIDEKNKEKINVSNEPINETQIEATTKKKPEANNKFKLNNLFRFLSNP